MIKARFSYVQYLLGDNWHYIPYVTAKLTTAGQRALGDLQQDKSTETKSGPNATSSCDTAAILLADRFIYQIKPWQNCSYPTKYQLSNQYTLVTIVMRRLCAHLGCCGPTWWCLVWKVYLPWYLSPSPASLSSFSLSPVPHGEFLLPTLPDAWIPVHNIYAQKT